MLTTKDRGVDFHPDFEFTRFMIKDRPNKDGTISGSFRYRKIFYRYTAMYLHGLKTMSVTELRFRTRVPGTGEPIWKRLGTVHGSRMRLGLVRLLNKEIAPDRRLEYLIEMPPARPERVGG